MRYIKSGVDSGATLQAGGDRLGSKGYFIQPTIFSDVKVWFTCITKISWKVYIHA